MPASLFGDMVGSAGYIVVGDMAGLGGGSSGVVWAGWHKILTTDANGNLSPNQWTAISNWVIGDSYDMQLSGPFTPSTPITSATLYVDTLADVAIFNTACVVVKDGSTGTYEVDVHVGATQSAMLTTTPCLYSIVILCGTDRWVPVNGGSLFPQANLAV